MLAETWQVCRDKWVYVILNISDICNGDEYTHLYKHIHDLSKHSFYAMFRISKYNYRPHKCQVLGFWKHQHFSNLLRFLD